MPKLGLIMTEATIVAWHKQDGDPVEEGDLLFTIETEKVTLDIEAPESGVLRILISAGETVEVMTPVARLLIPDAEFGGEGFVAPRLVDQVRATPKARALARRLEIALSDIGGTGPRGMIVSLDVEGAAASPALKASPVARRVAEEAGLELATLCGTGTGPGGRIMRQDVELALESLPRFPSRAVKMEAPSVSAGLPSGEQGLLTGADTGRVGEITPLSGLRTVIAQRLSASWRERPHVTLTIEADATNLVSARQQAIAELGEKVSYDAFLVIMVARALREHGDMNARLTEEGIEKLTLINIGIAVDTEGGLLVPVVRDATAKSLVEIQQTLLGLVERAVAGRSLPDDLAGGTFTITNLGMYGIDAFTPIINSPESGILGVGRIVAKPVAVDGRVVVRDTVTLSLSFDHRLIDGAPAARFLQRVKQLVERPFALAVLG